MNLRERLSALFFRKESLARTVMSINQVGKPLATPANYENFARFGFQKNVAVFRSISMISGAARGMSFILYDKKNAKNPKEISEHPLLKLWNKPNPLQSTADLIENFVAFYLLAGNSYLEANYGAARGALPLELWPVRPDKMKVIPGFKGYPKAYAFSNGGISREWEVDVVNMKSDILHWKTFHPLNDWYGMAALEAALMSLDQNLAGQMWNLALLQNSATPSGVLQVKASEANPRGEITKDQYSRMRNDFEENFQGVKNSGKPMIIEGGLTWTQMSFSPRDVDYSKGRELTATDISLVFGIPPELLGLGQKTFNNYREARLAFYEETVLPTMDSAMGAINRWLSPAFGESLYLDYDRDDIEILQWKREQRYTSLGGSNFLTQNEKREAVGYQKSEGWDVFVIGNQVGALPEDFSGGGGLVSDEETEGTTGKPGQDNIGEDEKPPKKPVEDEPKPEEETEEDEDSKTSWKSLNLLNANEKRQSWKRQNARRAKLQKSFESAVKEDFKELVTDLKKVKGNVNDARLTEYSLLKIIDDFMPTLEKTLKRHIRYTLEDFGGVILGEGKNLGLVHESKATLKFDSYVKGYTERRSGSAIKTITQTTSKKIKSIVGEWTQTAIIDGDSTDELSKFIGLEFEELTPSMATRIARTEVSMASNNGALEAVKSLEIPNMFKEWVTANDDRVRDGTNLGADHGAMNGAEVGLDEKFGVPPDTLMEGPGDPGAPADQVINCRCVLTYRSKN